MPIFCSFQCCTHFWKRVTSCQTLGKRAVMLWETRKETPRISQQLHSLSMRKGNSGTRGSSCPLAMKKGWCFHWVACIDGDYTLPNGAAQATSWSGPSLGLAPQKLLCPLQQRSDADSAACRLLLACRLPACFVSCTGPV